MQQFRQLWASRKRALLSGTAFAGVMLAGVAGQPDRALAACIFSDANTFSCGSTVTGLADIMIHAAGDATTGTIEAGATISGLGLAIVADPGGSLNIINNGAVTGSTGLALGSVGGNISYSGNGSASGGLAAAGLSIFAGSGTIAVGTADTPVIPNFSGFAGLATVSSTVTSIFLNGGSLSSLGASGLQMQGGDVSATLTGGTTIANAGTAGTGYGIFASSIAGPTSIASDANIGGAGSSFAYGIMSEGDDSIALSQTGGTIHAATAGLAAISTGDDAVSVDTAAGSSISMDDWHVGAGIRVSTQAAAVNVRAAGTISNTQAGIMVDSVTGAVNVTAAGTISGTQFGIAAQSAGLVNVAVPGTISALGAGVMAVGDNITVAVDGEITAGAVGIFAGGGGTHDAQISVGSGATVQGTSLAGVWVGANNSRIDNSGTIVGGIMSGGGGTTVNNAGSISSITGAGGPAVYFQPFSHDNVFIMNGPNAKLTGQATGSGSGTNTFRFAGSGSNSFDAGQIDAGWTLLDKVDSSNWSLTGTSTYAGPVTVNGGTLSVNGDLTSASNVTVNAGGTLGGNGTVGNTTIGGGTLAPGNSVGTLTVNGNLTFDASSSYLTEVTRVGADKTVITGTASLDGKVVVKPLAHVGRTTTYTIMTAGTESGAFSGVDFLAATNFARNPQLTYAGNDVLLTLDAGLLVPELLGDVTPNQKSVATGINNSILGGTIMPDSFDALFALSGSPLRAALSQLSGEVHASVNGMLVEDSRFVRDAAIDRLRAAFEEAGATLTPVLAYGPDEKPMAVAADDAGPVFWTNGFGSRGSSGSDGNAASVDRDTGGLLIGADGMLGDWRLGILGGYSHSSFEVADRASSGSSDNYHLGLYGGTNWENLGFRSGLAYSWHDIETSRSISIPGFSDSLTGDYRAGTFQAFAELGYGIDLDGGTRFEPFANLSYVSLNTDGFREKGGAAALSAGSGSTDATFTTLGINVSSAFDLGGVKATARGMIGWRHAFGDTTPLAAQSFAFADSSTFTIAGAPIAKDAAVLEAGLDFALSDNATLGVSYTGQFGSHAHDNGAKANLSVRF